MPSVNRLAVTVFALFIYVNAQETEILQQQPECELMDPAAMQLRICELQRQVEQLASLLVNGVILENHIASESATPIKPKRKNEFIRFGKRKNEFIRFGKRKNEFIRFGRSDGGNPEELNEQFIRLKKFKNTWPLQPDLLFHQLLNVNLNPNNAFVRSSRFLEIFIVESSKMNPFSQLTCALIILAISFATIVASQKIIQTSQKGNPEMLDAAQFYGGNTPDSEILNKVQGQLFNTLELLQAYQEGGPLKFAEKRRNKFEFIRFGRR
uniref:Uncharacterized protein n=1 Tax=Panagrolaimus sp. JU765 TaxID=591449 RepID=A0AC34QSI2_9BILA